MADCAVEIRRERYGLARHCRRAERKQERKASFQIWMWARLNRCLLLSFLGSFQNNSALLRIDEQDVQSYRLPHVIADSDLAHDHVVCNLILSHKALLAEDGPIAVIMIVDRHHL